jgi:tRNA wybutosine-synthesizing protein 1
MHSLPCRAPLRRQGYLFFSPRSTAALKPCLWCKSALQEKGVCYKQQFYGIESHRCVQMTPTLACNHRCLFCWRSHEIQVEEEETCPPEEILQGIPRLQKQALAGYKPQVASDRFREAAFPRHVALSLSGEPTLYAPLLTLLDLLHDHGYTTFLVSNGTRPEVLEQCFPFQLYVSLVAPDEETYMRLCRPIENSWGAIQESLGLLGKRRSAIRVTLVAGYNDHGVERYAAMIQDAAPTFVEVKGFMHVGYSRNRLRRENMPEHHHVVDFARSIEAGSDYRILDENPLSRVVLLRREA